MDVDAQAALVDILTFCMFVVVCTLAARRCRVIQVCEGRCDVEWFYAPGQVAGSSPGLVENQHQRYHSFALARWQNLTRRYPSVLRSS